MPDKFFGGSPPGPLRALHDAAYDLARAAWGLAATALAALPVAFVPFPGRAFVSSAIWPLLTIAAAAAWSSKEIHHSNSLLLGESDLADLLIILIGKMAG